MEINPAQLGHVKPLKPGATTAEEQLQNARDLKKAYTDFVGKTFFGQMLKAMRSTVDKPAYFHGGQAEEMFRSQLDQHMADAMSDGQRGANCRPDVRAAVSAAGEAPGRRGARGDGERTDDTWDDDRPSVAAAVLICGDTPGHDRGLNGRDSVSAVDNNILGVATCVAAGAAAAAQRELLSLLATKRDLSVQRDHQGLAMLAQRERSSARSCAPATPSASDCWRRPTPRDCRTSRSRTSRRRCPHVGPSRWAIRSSAAREQARLIRHECLTQWVAVQRTVLHLAQMLEIIATGGRAQPTYGKGRSVERGGALIDQAV